MKIPRKNIQYYDIFPIRSKQQLNSVNKWFKKILPMKKQKKSTRFVKNMATFYPFTYS